MHNSPSNTVYVTVESGFVEQQSKPEKNHFVFFYTITIHNDSTVPCQLLSRHWLITDSNLKSEEVYGEGVIGEQPLINAGESYQYTSGAVIETEIGTMEGRYFMIKKTNDQHDGNVINEFEVFIPKFTLSVPRVLH